MNRIWPITSAIITGAMLSALVCFAALGAFARLTADDYVAAADRPIHAFYNALFDQDRGRYAMSFVKTLLLPWGPPVVKVMPAACLLLWLPALWWLLREWSEWSGSSSRYAFLAACVVLWATIEGTESNQSLYWPHGLLAYSAPMAISTVLGAAYLSLCKKVPDRWSTSLWFTLGVFIAGGFSETVLFLNGAILVVAVLFATGAPLRRPLWWGAGASAASLLCQLLTPSNTGWSHQAPSRTIAGVSGTVLWGAARVFARLIVCEPVVLLAVILAGLLWGMQAAGSSAKSAWIRSRNVWLTGLTAVFVAAIPAAAILGDLPDSRSEIVLHFTAILMIFSSAYDLARISAVQNRIRKAPWIVAMGLLVTLGPMLSVADVRAESRDAATYAAAWDARDQSLRAFARANVLDVTVESIPEQMNLVRGLSFPRGDPSWDWNKWVANYYGLRTLKVTGDPLPPTYPEVKGENCQIRLRDPLSCVSRAMQEDATALRLEFRRSPLLRRLLGKPPIPAASGGTTP